jgi:formyltetrahydrofolate-dependent phosphoribosylglycinamide formyltransferase
MTARIRTAVLISGRGSNMASLLQAAADPTYPARIVAVISNRPEAAGLELARQAGVEAVAIDHRTFGRDRGAHESALHGALVARGVRLVCMAGYMRLLTPFFVGVWSGRLLNIHPSLLPAFPGLHTHQRALQAGVKIHGCTVHWVTEGMDEGTPIAQAAVPVLPGDTPETLGARVLEQEHILYPVALRLAAGGKPSASAPAAALINPAPV